MTANAAVSSHGAGAAGSQAALPRDGDLALVERCLAGDQEAFRPLVQRHQRRVFSVSYRMLGSRADAEDVAQQAFLDAYAALDRFRGEGRDGAFASWLLRIAVNRCKDILKSSKRSETALAEEVGADQAIFSHRPDDPEASAAQAHDRRALERAVATLPPNYREILVLKDVEELSFEEIQEILRLPMTTLKMRAVRAREMMRAALAEGKAP